MSWWESKIQAEGYYPRTAEDDQAQIIKAARARWCGFGRAAENASWHQECTGRCDAAGSRGNDDCSHHDRNRLAATLRARLPRRGHPQEAWLQPGVRAKGRWPHLSHRRCANGSSEASGVM